MSAQFHANLGKPGVKAIILLSQMSRVSLVYIYLYIFSSFALNLSKTVARPTRTSEDVVTLRETIIVLQVLEHS